jgi:1,4-dihydroxy-2-naphthoate octaprenyltransferase
MPKFNLMRPLLILAVAYFAKSMTTLICILLGASQELAGNLGFIVMMVAGIYTYTRLNKTRNKR